MLENKSLSAISLSDSDNGPRCLHNVFRSHEHSKLHSFKLQSSLFKLQASTALPKWEEDTSSSCAQESPLEKMAPGIRDRFRRLRDQFRRSHRLASSSPVPPNDPESNEDVVKRPSSASSASPTVSQLALGGHILGSLSTPFISTSSQATCKIGAISEMVLP